MGASSSISNEGGFSEKSVSDVILSALYHTITSTKKAASISAPVVPMNHTFGMNSCKLLVISLSADSFSSSSSFLLRQEGLRDFFFQKRNVPWKNMRNFSGS